MDTGEKVLMGFFVGLALLIGSLIVGSMLISHIGPVNDGQHTGYVTAVEQEGWIFKTWRAYIKTDPQSSQEDKYCVTDESLIKQLKERAKDRKLITVDYSAPFIIWNTQCAREGSILRSIE